MYIPSSFAERDLPTLHAFIEAHPLAALVTNTAIGGLIATHLPLVLDRSAGPAGTLIGHVARASPHARSLGDGPLEALVIYAGPDAYVTPAWYPTKQATGRVVPTWNYVAVHAYGMLRVHDDPAFLRAHLDALTGRHEASRSHPWEVGDAPDDYVTQQLGAIIGVEVRIDRIEGKWKMSQNRPEADIDGVIEGLAGSGDAKGQTVAAIVRERRPETG